MSLTVKAFLFREWSEDPIEIRRFSIDQDVSTNYAYLTQKIAQVFPSLRPDGIIIAWTDGDGDRIVISSDEELLEALDNFDGAVFRLYLKKRDAPPAFSGPPREPQVTLESDNESNDSEEGEGGDREGTQQQQQQQHQGQEQGVFHPGVICDECSGPIYGIRFKCLVCNDYDLCSSCERKGVHVAHNMISIQDPFSYNPWGFHHMMRGGFPWMQRGRGNRGPCGRGAHRHPHGHPHHHHGHSHPPMGAPWMLGSGGCHPYMRFGGRQGGCCGGYGRRPFGGQCGQQPKPKDQVPPSEKDEAMDTEQQAKRGQEEEEATLEQQRSFLRNIGDAVSSFLQPLGIKVDVDVTDETSSDQQPKPKEPASTTEEPPTEVPSGSTVNTAYPPQQFTLDPAFPPTSGNTTAEPTTEGASPFPSAPSAIEEVVSQLRSMGFDDEGGWLTELVKAKGGDIGKVLDALHPSQST